MFTKLVSMCALMAMTSAGLLPEPHYSSGAVSSQNYIRHDQSKLAVAAPVYHAGPAVAYHAQPAVSYHAAPAVAYQSYQAAPAVAYQSYQAAPAVAYQSYQAAPAVAYQSYQAAPAVGYQSYQAAPITTYAAPSAKVAYAAAPVAKLAYAHQEEIAYPKYDYTYSVSDGHTGDQKSQQESRDGDVVKGSYSFHEADGSVRTVQYTADDHHGFNAVVHNSAPTPAPQIIKAAPVLLKAAAPVYYHH